MAAPGGGGGGSREAFTPPRFAFAPNRPSPSGTFFFACNVKLPTQKYHIGPSPNKKQILVPLWLLA